MSEKRCTECHVLKALDQFRPRVKTSKGGQKGEPNAICEPCEARRRTARQAREARKRKEPVEREHIPDKQRKRIAVDLDNMPDTPPGLEKIPTSDLGEISVLELTDKAGDLKAPYYAIAQVNAQATAPAEGTLGLRGRADKVAGLIGLAQGLHWTYSKHRTLKRSRDEIAESFWYHCAQSDQREANAKTSGSSKARDTRRMPRFPCNGWLHVTVREHSDIMQISIKHEADHLPYVDITIPTQWKEFIEQHARSQTPGKIWQGILAATGGRDINFKSSAVYYHWTKVTRKDWRLDNDPFVSARKFIEARGADYKIVLMDIKPEPGTRVLGFYIQDFMDAWATHTQELAMDSTWNTNGGNFELFSAVADANGAGIPLAFLFIHTEKDANTAGAKQTVLERFLHELKARGVEPEYTLTDKDWSEINAMRSVWPDSKHQLCFWHALRALKQRLCKNKDAPAPYQPTEAKRQFSFIDEHFVPAAQQPADGSHRVSAVLLH
ncbi:hypothetical protein NUW54_g8481 [Trametes sanguinea]|uniref:Uncharacterized protein n=1 Tax=Trametes sanguinea TaxID=158606 RepID=A0ACC1PE18_9APHY|nr:hypothetical protein NUW54_g8481 [Trametes sanguinea]